MSSCKGSICEDIRPLTEYVGCKTKRNYSDRSFRFIQPVIIQKFTDKVSETKKESKLVTYADLGTVLANSKECEGASKPSHTYFRYGVEKMLHMTRWSRP